MHDMSLVFKCGWKMSHRTLLTLIRQICLLFNKVHSLDSQKKKKGGITYSCSLGEPKTLYLLSVFSTILYKKIKKYI